MNHTQRRDCGKHLTNAEIEILAAKSYEVRKLCLEMVSSSGWGHIGGSFSQADLLACLYKSVLRIDAAHPSSPYRDRFILSKAHASPALYAVLAIQGFIPRERVFDYCRLDGLDGHTQRGQCPGVEYSGGSLGTGLSYGVGVALALRLQENYRSRVYCMLGDGECNEGQIWEAAMSAAQYRLDNLIAIVDYNKVMAKGKISDLMPIEPLAAKFQSFGWRVIEIDGHDFENIYAGFHQAKYLEMRGYPVVVIAHTVKGRGVPECEFNYHWHTHAPDGKQAESFLAALNAEYGQDGQFEFASKSAENSGLETIVLEALE